MTRSPVSLAAALLLANFAACSSNIVESQPIPQRLAVSPVDGSTGLATLAVDLMIHPQELGAAVLAALGSASTLATWPDKRPLPTRTVDRSKTETHGPNGFPVDSYAAIRLEPLTPVAPGEYAVLLGPLSPETQATPEQLHALPDGGSVVRVRVGGAPVLWGLSACSKNDGKVEVLVHFSEPVAVATPSAAPLAVTATGTCTADPFPPMEQPRDKLSFMCAGPADSFTLNLTGGLRSASGVEVAPVQQVIARAALLQVFASGCTSTKFDP